MADSEKGTDGTPIKPVSSLRSHFENMASLKPSPRTQSLAAPQTPLQRLQGQKDNHGPERVSLDIPRRPSPVLTQRNSVIQASHIGARTPGDLISQQQPSNPPSRRRPTSMISLSSPQSTPIVTIDAPLSPSKPFALPKARFPSRSPTTSPSRSTETRSRPQHALPIPPMRSANASPISETERYSVPDRNFSHDSKLLHGGANISPTYPISNIVPPPVKRAEKPKIFNKPAASRSNTNLAIDLAVFSNRVSPFSTPSSSDDNLEPDTARSRGNLSIVKGQSERGSQSHEQSMHRNVKERKFDDAGDVDSKPSRPGPHQRGNFQLSTSPKDLKFKPGLPPRPEVDKKLEHSPKPRPVSMLTRTWTEQTGRQESVAVKVKPRIPSAHSNTSTDAMFSRSDFLPPPRPQTSIFAENFKNDTTPRSLAQDLSQGLSQPLVSNDLTDPESLGSSATQQMYPDTSNINRRPPYLQQGVKKIETYCDTKVFDISSRYICLTGQQIRAWDLVSGGIVLNPGHDDKDMRVTALAFKPGASPSDEGLRIWLGTKGGDLQEVDIPSQTVPYTKLAAHNREIVKIYRYQNSMWTLDDDGRLYIWPAGEEGLPSLQLSPVARRVSKGHNCSLIIHDTLWIAIGKEIRVFRPHSKDDAGFCLTKQALSQPGAGEITSGAVIASQLHCVYFGHTNGKITSYSTKDFSCLGVFNVSVYKINCLVGAGSYLWAGYNSGMICVYDTSARPWGTKKEWQAHPNRPVTNILVERSSLWRSGFLQVASIGMDNTVRIWDGLLEQDWLEADMQHHDADYCGFREIEAVVLTWNAGASKPTNLRYDEKDINSFREVLHVETPPEILVFGFQELVDLDDKKLTAKSFFKGNKKKDATEQEHMSRQYRAWRDFLVRFIEENMPPDEPYQLLHTASMMGLFSCIFVKSSQRSRIRNVCAAEIKRGLGGLHGNKGAIILRFILDNTSICFVNCHLAAGQSQTVHRNKDAAVILESAILPPEKDPTACCDSFVGGGDGTMILDHEICVLNGDLNYRIDTMGPETVIKAVKADNFSKLLERDQLLVSRRRNPNFCLRVFAESPILFAPTYKYDVGSDNYDSSEKHRAPAWCDRILYRGGNIEQLEYRRHEVQVSDHRPVSGTFRMRIKTCSPEKRVKVWEQCMQRLDAFKQKVSSEAKIKYLRDVLGVDVHEAKNLISDQEQ